MGRAVVLATPGVALGVAGLRHPMHLTYATSEAWWTLHVPGLLLFPLVGVALMALVAGRRDPVAVVAVLLAFGYATAYSALDVVDGIAAGYVTHRLGPGQPRPDEVRYLFDVGRPFGVVGGVALVIATFVVALDAVVRRRLAALPAVLMVPGALLVLSHHIFAPEGVLGMVMVGLSTGWLGYLGDGSASTSSGPDGPDGPDGPSTFITAERSSGP